MHCVGLTDGDLDVSDLKHGQFNDCLKLRAEDLATGPVDQVADKRSLSSHLELDQEVHPRVLEVGARGQQLIQLARKVGLGVKPHVAAGLFQCLPKHELFVDVLRLDNNVLLRESHPFKCVSGIGLRKYRERLSNEVSARVLEPCHDDHSW